jgi:hypothetical protein
MHAIARISQQKRSQPVPTPMMPAAHASAGTAARTLPSGFLNGGNQRVDSQAEVMRLAATVDSLNTKLNSQTDRLQRTEFSLSKANRSMTSERATSNARLLRMQNEVKELRAREVSLKENAVAQARRELQKSDSAFGESVKRAEQFDAKLTTLQDTIKTLTGERDALSTQITGLAAELNQSAARAATAESRLAEMPDGSEKDAKIAAILATLKEETMQRKAFAEKLAAAESKHSTVVRELEDTKAATAATAAAAVEVTATAAAVESAHAAARKALQDEVQELLAQNTTLKEQLVKIEGCGGRHAVMDEGEDGEEGEEEGGEDDEDVVATDAMATDVVEAAEAPPPSSHSLVEVSTTNLKAELEDVETNLATLFDHLNADDTVYRQTGMLAKRRHDLSTALQAREPPPLPTFGSPAAFSVPGALEAFGCYYGEAPGVEGDQEEMHDAVEDDQKDGVDDAGGTEAAPSKTTIVFESTPSNLNAHLPFHSHAMHPVRARLDARFRASQYETMLVRRPFNAMAQFRLHMEVVDTNAMATGASEVPPDVAALIEAVSKDISNACIRTREKIQRRLGMSDEEIQKDLSAYA